MIGFLRSLGARLAGRSPKWPAVERAFRKTHPACEACGGTADLDVHHVEPFHVRPDLELEPGNLMTLCRPHHLTFGHLMLWAAWNPDVRQDAAAYRLKVDHRPKG